MERLAKLKKRLVLYGISLAVLVLLLLISLWTIIGTGAFLTSENDWQGLAGDYRIGTIDYTVQINDSYFLKDSENIYNLAVPIQGGVRIFDPTLTSASLRNTEFGEGCTLVRVRIVNHSYSMVNVAAAFTLDGSNEIKVLPIPTDWDQAGAESLEDRSYVLSTLNMTEPTVLNDAAASLSDREKAETEALTKLQEKYQAYYTNGASVEYTNEFKIDLLPGVIDANASGPPSGAIQDGDLYCYYKDVFFLVWCEYSQDHDSAYVAASAEPAIPQARFSAKFTVGQMD